MSSGVRGMEGHERGSGGGQASDLTSPLSSTSMRTCVSIESWIFIRRSIDAARLPELVVSVVDRKVVLGVEELDLPSTGGVRRVVVGLRGQGNVPACRHRHACDLQQNGCIESLGAASGLWGGHRS